MKVFNDKLNDGPNTPVPPARNAEITTPAGQSASDCLQQVESISRSTLAKNAATTRDGRNKLTSIYNKMRKGKKDPMPRKGRKLHTYDVDGKGNERFEAAYKLMFAEGYTASKAAKQIVGESQMNAFRIALCKCVCTCVLTCFLAHCLCAMAITFGFLHAFTARNYQKNFGDTVKDCKILTKKERKRRLEQVTTNGVKRVAMGNPNFKRYLKYDERALIADYLEVCHFLHLPFNVHSFRGLVTSIAIANGHKNVRVSRCWIN